MYNSNNSAHLSVCNTNLGLNLGLNSVLYYAYFVDLFTFVSSFKCTNVDYIAIIAFLTIGQR